MTETGANFYRNYLKLDYAENEHRFVFANREFRRMFMKEFERVCLKNENMNVCCNKDTFSARDGASIKFTQSEFYENMLDSLGYSRNEDIIRNMRGLKKVDINYDTFCGGDRLLEKRIKDDPMKFIDENTPVCYIFRSEFEDEKYEYDIYIKIFIRGDKINVMSLHWDGDDKVRPSKVWNHREKTWDDIEKVEEFLEEKLNNYERER